MASTCCLVFHFRAVCTVYFLIAVGIFSRIHVLGAAGLAPDQHGHSEAIFGDPFEEILGRLEEVSRGGERNITRDETNVIIRSLLEERMLCGEGLDRTNCQKCLDANNLFSILGVQTSDGLDEENFNRACVVLLYYVNDLESTCANATWLSAQAFDYFAREIQMSLDGTPRLSEEEFQAVLDAVAESYKADNFAKCFTAETVFEAAVANHEAGADDHELQDVAAILISSLVRGFCIGNATEVDPEAFLDDIFDSYASNTYMSEEEFEMILDKLLAGSQGGSTPDDPHDHARRRRGVDTTDSDHAHEGEELDVHSCFSIDGLFEIFDVNHSVGVTRQQFKELSPALIQQTISSACAETETNVPSRPSVAEIWGYGMLAVFIISLCAIAGVAFLPCLNTEVYLKVLQTMMALAVATLIGDAVIHLIPQAVGLHAHDTSGASGAHNAGSAELAYIWKCLVVVGAVYIFFIFESLMQMFGGGHSHSLEPDDDPTKRKRSSSMRLKEAVDGSFRSRSPSNAQLEMTNGDVTDGEADNMHGQRHTKSKVCFGMGTLPFMILIGDGLHNLGDGLAIGAAFATSLGAGLSTSIAVLCHELPHELGDFAVLLNAGLSFRKALGFNILSACMAFIGLCIGIPLAANEEARQWIFAVAAGMFLYVALVDMLPELIHHENKNKAAIFLLHNVGFLVGSAIILLIALYEDSINISI